MTLWWSWVGRRIDDFSVIVSDQEIKYDSRTNRINGLVIEKEKTTFSTKDMTEHNLRIGAVRLPE